MNRLKEKSPKHTSHGPRPKKKKRTSMVSATITAETITTAAAMTNATETTITTNADTTDEITTTTTTTGGAVLIDHQDHTTSPIGGTKKKVSSKRQKQFCFYCQTLVSKLARHLRDVHESETEIKNLDYLSPKRKRARLSMLRKKGAALFNEQHDEKIASRGLSKPQANYVACKSCQYLYQASSVQKHESRREKEKSVPTEESYETQGQNDLYKNVLKNMKKDDIYLMIIKDELILDYGSRIMERNETDENIHNIPVDQSMRYHVGTKMRELGKLLAKLREKTGLNDKHLQFFLTPHHFFNLVEAVKELTGFNTTPSFGLKVGYSLQTCIDLLITKGMFQEDKDYIDQMSNFLALFKKEWSFRIATKARRTLEEIKWNKQTVLPQTSDIAKFLDHIVQECDKLIETEFTKTNWKQVLGYVLAYVIVFNRRRTGEVSKMKIDQFLASQESNMDMDVNAETMSEEEQYLSKSFHIVYVRGKNKKKAPVLLTPQMKKYILWLLENRHKVVNETDRNFFSTGKGNRLRGEDEIRKVVKTLGIESNMTSTILRKHIATVAQILNLGHSELEQLAEHMGHRLDVHKNFYRLSNDQFEKGKLAKLFMCVAAGPQFVKNFKNKTLDEISIDDSLIKKILGTGAVEEAKEQVDDEDKEETEVEDEGVVEKQIGFQFKKKINTEIVVTPKKHLLRENKRKKVPQEEDSSTGIDDSEADESYVPTPVHNISDEEVTEKSRKKTKTVKKTSNPRQWTDDENQYLHRTFYSSIIMEKIPPSSQIVKKTENNSLLKSRSIEQIRQRIRRMIEKNKK